MPAEIYVLKQVRRVLKALQVGEDSILQAAGAPRNIQILGLLGRITAGGKGANVPGEGIQPVPSAPAWMLSPGRVPRKYFRVPESLAKRTLTINGQTEEISSARQHGPD